ncbi:MAG: hypothetical protein MZV63_20895 [Marinilabiliales bacterium]|nr:hypothetical protein [Marinilabiliales bacterium]
MTEERASRRRHCLWACFRNRTAQCLIVNGFDRISGPAWFDRDGMAGVAWWNDRGVADTLQLVRHRATSMTLNAPHRGPMMTMPAGDASYSDSEGRISSRQHL